MAGAPWQFTLLPDSINTVTITNGSTTVTVNRGSGKSDDAFLTGAFVETTIVTISAVGYNDLTNVTVGDTNLIMTKAFTIIDVITDDYGKVLTFNNKPLVYILPNDYTRVNYIASTGTQHIDTGVVLTNNTLVCEWEGRDDNTSGSTSLFSAEYVVGANNLRDFAGVLHGRNTGRAIYIGRTTGMRVGYSSTDGLFHKWSLNIGADHTVYLVKDGTKLTTYSWTGDLDKFNSIALFCNHTTSSFSQKASVAYKYFRMRDEGGWLFWGIPAKRNSDSVLGMYDLITKQFFTNAGTGTFVEG